MDIACVERQSDEVRPVVLALLWCPLWLAASGCVQSSDHTSPLYEGCSANSDCTTDAEACFRIAYSAGNGKMCSLHCTTDADCPGDARCYELVGDPTAQRICYARCTTDRDCSGVFQCVDATMMGTTVDSICLPR